MIPKVLTHGAIKGKQNVMWLYYGANSFFVNTNDIYPMVKYNVQ